MSKTLAHTIIKYEELILISNETKKCCELEERIRMMESQRSDLERDKLVEDGKRIRIDEMIKQSEKMIIQNGCSLLKIWKQQ